MTLLEYLDHEERVRRGQPRDQQTITVPAEDIREVGRGGLHEQIIKHCNAQRPRWKYIHSRTDKKSTLDKGVSDFTIFIPRGKVLSVEVKVGSGKLTEEQMAWAKEMEMLGHVVHVVRSFDQFVELCRISAN